MCLCVCVEPFQAHLRADGLKVEPSGAKMEGQLVKRESADNILAEEGDGMQMCAVWELAWLENNSRGMHYCPSQTI